MSGITVFTGHRIKALARPGEVLVSSTVKDLVARLGLVGLVRIDEVHPREERPPRAVVHVGAQSIPVRERIREHERVVAAALVEDLEAPLER